MAACWPLQMPPTPKAVLVSLADNANDQGVCWPSIATISKRTCFSERAVQNAIRWLEDQGYLVADRSNGRHTRYEVNAAPTPAAPAPPPPQEVHPRTTCTPAADAPNPRSRCVGPPQEVPTNRQEPSGTVNTPSPADAGEREQAEPGQGGELPAAPSTPAGRVCKAMRALGVARVNPSHPNLLTAFAEGVAEKTLIDTAAEFVADDPDCFAYAVTVARKRHARGAKPIATTSTGASRHDRASDQPRESLVDRAASRAARIFAEHGFDTST